MPNSHKSIGFDELYKSVEDYKKIFETVRLLDKNKLDELKRKCDETGAGGGEGCFFFDRDGVPCLNCVSVAAYVAKSDKTKIETDNNRLYYVFAKYIEVDGEPYVIEMLNPVDEDSYIGRDGINAVRNRNSVYHNRVNTDILTGALNRRFYEENIKNNRFTAGVAMMDIDDFKLYNDFYGHNIGDMVLKTFVAVITGCLRDTDTLIRYGGDEFMLVMPNISEESFIRTLQRIKRKLNSANIPGIGNKHLSMSTGAVIAENEPIHDAFARADKLLLLAKAKKNIILTEKDAAVAGQSKEQPLILLADDSEMNRDILSVMLGSDFRIIEAVDGEDCIEKLNHYGMRISLLLLDIVMPKKDGFDVLEYMNDKNIIDDVPVIIITGDNASSTMRRAYELGISDYINRPFDSNVVCRRVYNTIKLYAKQRRLVQLITDKTLEKEENNTMIIDLLCHVVEFRSCGSEMHGMQMRQLTELLLTRLNKLTDKYGVTGHSISIIANAAVLHDIGKISIPESILNKPGRLTAEEFELMKTHTVIGEQILENLQEYQDNALIKVAEQICRWHHERYDGGGYPDGLKGDEIPISAQAVALADVYSALISDRSYKKAYSHEKALQMILDGECGQFNPLLIRCLLECADRIKNMM